MIDRLILAEDQIRLACDNYARICLNIENCLTQGKSLGSHDPPSEICRLLDTQLDKLASCQAKLQEIKIPIRRARNYSSGIAPINSLPPEIMAQIFHYVQTPLCHLRRLPTYDKHYYSTYPEYLAHVCSLWRKITISSPSLWSHIDLTPHIKYFRALSGRAMVYITRSGGVPLELHSAGDNYHNNEVMQPGYNALFRSISQISTRASSLKIETKDFGVFHRGVFRELLLSRDSILTKLDLQSAGLQDTLITYRDFEPTGPEETWGDWVELDVTVDQLESAFASLTTLHLCGIFPSWSSKAYHGLVDLRLLSASVNSSIPEAELIAILSSCPELCILHFKLKIRNSAPESRRVEPVHLRDLQVVKIFQEYSELPGSPSDILRLLAPGMKSLRLFLSSYHSSPTLLANLDGFFSRSRVVRFYSKTPDPPMGILRDAVHIEQVVIDDRVRRRPSQSLAVGELGSLQRLKSLTFMNCTILEDELRSLVDYYPSGISLYSCDISRKSSDETLELSAEDVLEIFPTVRIIEGNDYSMEDPVADWDILD